MQDDLTGLKDDMTAFIEGHGMRRYSGFVNSEEVPCVPFDAGDNPDGWKDFVELAKASGSPFLTMNSFTLSREDLDYVIDTLRNSHFADDDEVDEAKWLRTHVGKTGFVQLGWSHQGLVYIFESSTEWYERYQRLMEMAEEFGGMVIDETDQDDEKY
jgi:hypothetical protein